MKDVYGNKISAGTVIVYPARKGSGMWLTQATVKRVNRFSNWDWSAGKPGYGYEIEAVRDGVVKDGSMTPVNERIVTLTRADHILVVG